MNGKAINGQRVLISPFMYGNQLSYLSAMYPPAKEDERPRMPEMNSFDITYDHWKDGY